MAETRKAATPKRAAADAQPPAAAQARAARARAALPHPVPPREETLRPAGTPAAAADAEPPGPLNGMPFQPVRLTTQRDPAAGPEPRVTLFFIDDKPYDVPAKPSPGVGLQFLHVAARQARAGNASGSNGMDVRDAVAIDQLMTDMLGDEGWEALRTCKTMSVAQFQQITEIATVIALGTIELPKGPAGE